MWYFRITGGANTLADWYKQCDIGTFQRATLERAPFVYCLPRLTVAIYELSQVGSGLAQRLFFEVNEKLACRLSILR